MLDLESGEQLPVLTREDWGEPLYEPLMFSLLDLRNAGLATNTIAQALRSIMQMQLALEADGVNLSERLASGSFLSASEVQRVVDACSSPISVLKAEAPAKPLGNVRSLEQMRMRSGKAPRETVSASTKFVRLHYIGRYLEWLLSRALLAHKPGSTSFEHLRVAGELALRTLRNNTPSVGRRNAEDQRQGLGNDQLDALRDVISPDHELNPWNEGNRERNRLIVRWLLELGLRRAEALVVRIPDIDFQANTVLIARRPDDPEDPRRIRPRTKTADRLLPLPPDLAADTHAYIIRTRRGIGVARKHPFLFVSSTTGLPLSLKAVNQICDALKPIEALDQKLSPHVLRHTWNDSFSHLADEQGFEAAEEQKMRARLMGWSETGNTVAKYTRRHTRKKSREASLQLQAKLAPKDGTEQ